MHKRLLQDVVSKDGSTSETSEHALHDRLPSHEQGGSTMRIPPRRKHTETKPEPRLGIPPKERESAFEYPPRRPRPPFDPKHRNSATRSWFIRGTLVVLLLGLGSIYGVSTLLSGATVSVEPRVAEEILIDGSFVLRQDPESAEIGYTTVLLEKTADEEVEATRQEQVEEFASGEITIFNTFDENVQRLIRNTRFEAKEMRGPDNEPLIYRIRDSVDVPGMSTNAAGESVPGTVTVRVYADAPGETYNVEQAEFSIPGFRGSGRYDAFYARTATPIDGGFAGTRLTIENSVEQEARTQLQARLEQELLDAIHEGSDVPDGMHFFDSGAFFSFTSLPSQEASDESLTLREQGSLTALLINEQEFARRMAASAIADYDHQPVALRTIDDLTVTIERLESEDVEWDGDTHTMRVRGRITIVWLYDEQALQNDIRGISNDRAELRNILAEKHPGIVRAEIRNRPFWRRSLPDDPDRITIKEFLD